MWMRWNDSTHIFEQSTNDGASWAVLPLNASVINEGSISVSRLPGNLAVKDANNNFTVTQTMPALTVSTNATVGGTLGVTGATTLASLGVTGNATIGGTLGVTGATTHNANVTITAGGLVVTGTAQIIGNLGINGAGITCAASTGTTAFQFNMRNSNAGTSNNVELSLGTDVQSRALIFQSLSSGFVTSSIFSANGSVIISQGAGGLAIGPFDAAPLRFVTSGIERMRIDSAGVVCVGVTTGPFAPRFLAAADMATANLSVWQNLNSSNAGNFMLFVNSAGVIAGNIAQSGATSIVIGTTSDERLKFDLGQAKDLTSLRSLIIHDFEWKSDNKQDRGVFAQEAYKLYPHAILLGTDELTDNGNLAHPWMTDYSKFVTDLIVGWQEHDREIAELKRLFNGKSSN